MIERLKAAWLAFRHPHIVRYPHEELAFDLLIKGQLCIARGDMLGDQPTLQLHRLSWADTDAVKRYLGWA